MRYVFMVLLLLTLAALFLSSCASCAHYREAGSFYYERRLTECRVEYMNRHLHDLAHVEEDSMVYCLEHD